MEIVIPQVGIRIIRTTGDSPGIISTARQDRMGKKYRLPKPAGLPVFMKPQRAERIFEIRSRVSGSWFPNRRR